MYQRSTAGLLDKQSLVPQDNAAKGSRQNSCVTLEDSVAPKAEAVLSTVDPEGNGEPSVRWKPVLEGSLSSR